MKIKTYLTLFYTALFLVIGYCQENKPLKADFLELPKNSLIDNRLLAGEHGYYALELNYSYGSRFSWDDFTTRDVVKGGYLIHKFDKSCKLEKSVVSGIKYNSQRSKIIASFTTDSGELFFFIFSMEKKLKKKFVYLYRFDAITLEQIGSKKIVLESKFDNAYVDDFYQTPVVSVSPDRSKLLIYETELLKKRNVKLRTCVLNVRAEILHREDYHLQRKAMGTPEIKGGVIDDSMKLFFLKEDYHRKEREKYSVLSISRGAKEPREQALNINLNREKMLGLAINACEDNSVLVLSYYRQKKGNGMLGITYALVSDQQEEIEGTFVNFDPKYFKMKEDNSSSKSMNIYNLIYLKMNEKGNVIVVGEHRDVVTLSQNRKSGSSFDYENILISELDIKKGTLVNVEKIRKRENKPKRSRNCFIQEVGNDFYFVYNNNPKNKERTDKKKLKRTKKLFSKRKSEITVTKLDPNGKLDTFVILKEALKEGERTDALYMTETPDDEILIGVLGNEKFRLIKYKF